MQLVEQHIIQKGDLRWAELDALSFAAKNLSNLTNYHIRQDFFKTGNALGWSKLDKLLQKTDAYTALPAKVAQLVIKSVTDSWSSYFAAHKAWQLEPKKFKAEPKIPRYKHKEKGRFVLTYNLQAIGKRERRQGVIALSKTNLRFFSKHTRRACQVRVIPSTSHYTIELVYEKAVQNRKPATAPLPSRLASIDIGLDNLAAIVYNQPGFAPFLVNGRPLKSINQFYHQERARLVSLLAVENKTGDHKLDRKHSHRLNALTTKRNHRINHYLHVASRLIIDELVKQRVAVLVIGKNDGWKQEINLGKVTNQNFVSIPHARFIEMLTYKAKLEGIQVLLQEEAYTSKCSFLDAEPLQHQESYVGRRVKRGLFRSAKGIFLNADVNGAANIMRKAIPNAFAEGIGAVVVRPVRVTPYQGVSRQVGQVASLIPLPMPVQIRTMSQLSMF